MLIHGIPEHIRSDNGIEMISKRVRNYLQQAGVQTVFIEPDSPVGRTATTSPSTANSGMNA